MRRWWAAALVLSALLGVLGAVPSADNVTHRVLALTDQLPWSATWSAHWNPPPLGTFSVRPLSVLLLKLYGVAIDAPSPPVWVLALKGAASLLALMAGARAWLLSHRLSPWAALPVALLTPALFSAWYLPELDALAAGATLGGVAWMRRQQWVGAGLLLAAAFLFKESSALVTFAFLGAEAVASRDRRWLVPIGAGAAVWAVFAWQMAAGPDTVYEPGSRGSVFEHNLMQIVVLATPTGAVLLLLGALRRPALAWVGLAGLLVAPLAVAFSHYETWFFSPRPYAWVLAGALVAGLAGLAPRHRGPVLAVAATWTVFTGVMLVGPTTREDLASRLFLAAAVPLAGLVWASVERLTVGPHRHAAWALAGCAAWGVAAPAFNHVQDQRARAAVDRAARVVLARQDLDGAVVVFDNNVEPVGGEELQALGAPPSDTHFSFVPAWVRQGELPVADMGGDRIDLEALQQTPVFVLSLSGRTDGPVGDFSWTRRPWGMYRAIEGLHNVIEDQHLSQTRAGPSYLEAELQQRAQPLVQEQRVVYRLPRTLTEVPRRVLTGVPVLERVRWRAALYGI